MESVDMESTETPKRKGVCILCELASETDRTGKLSTKDSVTAHYHCALYSSGLWTKNSEDDDLFGFSPEDVKKEARRGKKLKCSHCRERGATVGCEVRQCPKSFHYPCAVNANAKVRKEKGARYVVYCENHHHFSPSKKVKGRKNSGTPLPSTSFNGESLSEFMPGPCTRPDAASSSPVKRQLHYNGSQQGSGCKRPKKTKASDASEDSEDVGDDMKSYMAPLDTDSDEMDSDNATQAPGVDGYAQVRPPVNLKEEEEISLELPRPVCDPSDPPEINAPVESDPAAAACLPSLPPTPGSSSVIPAPPALSPPRPDAKTSVPGPSCDAESFWKSCNESGKTQAIFAHFFARMQSIASKIQAEQANAEDCDVALKVMEVSGELEFQQKDITKTICALQKTADAMTRAISAAST